MSLGVLAVGNDISVYHKHLFPRFCGRPPTRRFRSLALEPPRPGQVRLDSKDSLSFTGQRICWRSNLVKF